MPPATLLQERTYKLPPLILHPFADASGPAKLMESSRASLIMQGLLPDEASNRDDLDRALLEGRYCEIRMLFYVGKDLVRWISQCLESSAREPELKGKDIQFQSFAALLIEDPPPTVIEKLTKWGVADYRAIFSRAIGLNCMFSDVPAKALLAEEFLRNYYRYADHLFSCSQSARSFLLIRSIQFDFDLFASGEYTRMLERQWEES